MSDTVSIKMRVSQNAPIRMDLMEHTGAINCVSGTFTTGESAGVETIHIPYMGKGYPIGLMIVLENGINSEPYASLISSGAIGAYIASKSIMNIPPDYAAKDNDKAQCVKYYKNSESSAVVSVSVSNAKIYRPDNPNVIAFNNLHIRSATEIRIIVRGDNNAFLTNTKYKYVVWYSE